MILRADVDLVFGWNGLFVLKHCWLYIDTCRSGKLVNYTLNLEPTLDQRSLLAVTAAFAQQLQSTVVPIASWEQLSEYDSPLNHERFQLKAEHIKCRRFSLRHEKSLERTQR